MSERFYGFFGLAVIMAFWAGSFFLGYEHGKTVADHWYAIDRTLTVTYSCVGR